MVCSWVYSPSIFAALSAVLLSAPLCSPRRHSFLLWHTLCPLPSPCDFILGKTRQLIIISAQELFLRITYDNFSLAVKDSIDQDAGTCVQPLSTHHNMFWPFITWVGYDNFYLPIMMSSGLSYVFWVGHEKASQHFSHFSKLMV